MKRLIVCGLAIAALPSRAMAQAPVVVTRDLPAQIGLTLIWAAVAAVLFVVAFKAVDMATPGDLKQQLADGNTAMAVFVAGLCIASAIIISALVN